MMFHNTEKTETRHGNVPQIVTGFAPVSQIANHCQLSCCIITFVTLE